MRHAKRYTASLCSSNAALNSLFVTEYSYRGVPKKIRGLPPRPPMLGREDYNGNDFVAEPKWNKEDPRVRSGNS